MVVTKDMIKAEVLQVERILVAMAGYDISVGSSTICIHRNENSRFEVTWQEDESGQEFLRVFSAAEEAAKMFVSKRHELGVGVDYEKGLLTRPQKGMSSVPVSE